MSQLRAAWAILVGFHPLWWRVAVWVIIAVVVIACYLGRKRGGPRD